VHGHFTDPIVSHDLCDLLEHSIILFIEEMSCSSLSLFCLYRCDEGHLCMFNHPHFERKDPFVDVWLSLESVVSHANAGDSCHTED
jgi:hypothetical protein